MTTLPASQLAHLHTRNIALDMLLTLVTFYLFNIWVQYKQILATNDILGEDKYSFVMWALLTLLTFGLYHIYHEYRMSLDLATKVPTANMHEPLISVILTVCGLSFIADAIQQAHINKYFGSTRL